MTAKLVTEIAHICDKCGHEVSMVCSYDGSPVSQLADMRRYLSKIGWITTDTEDLCPACREKTE